MSNIIAELMEFRCLKSMFRSSKKEFESFNSRKRLAKKFQIIDVFFGDDS